MIWIKEGKKVIGYAPFFKREFSDLEIRRFIKTTIKGINSKIVKLIFDIQGIYTSEYDQFNDIFIARIPADTLAEISFEFSNMKVLTENSDIEQYEDDMFNIFVLLQNIQFYKIEEIEESYVKDDIAMLSQKNKESLVELQEELNENNLPIQISELFFRNTNQSTFDAAHATRVFKPKEYK